MSWLDTLEEIRTRDFAQAPMADRERASREVINICSYAAAVASVSPLPFSDALLTLPIQSAMVLTLGHIYGRKLEPEKTRELIVEIGAASGAGFLARQGVKALLPVAGALFTVPAAFAANWAIGRATLTYFQDPTMTREALRQAYHSAVREGRALFSRERFAEFRKGNSSVPPVPPVPPTSAAPVAPEPPKVSEDAAPSSAPRALLDRVQARLVAEPERAKEVATRVHLEVQGARGGRWTLDLTGAGQVSGGLDGEPGLVMRCEAATLAALASGQKSVDEALRDGALELVPPDAVLARRVVGLFR
jgi:uncharacterized protein (DUF697 family)